jgi:CheY-like chemotaxis protein
LRLEGHDVKTANDGPQALACYQIFMPEVAVIDIGLPGMDGYEVARRLAQANSAPLLIALTGYGQQEDKLKSHAAGFHHHFIKPANPKEIHAVIMQPRRPTADLLEAN